MMELLPLRISIFDSCASTDACSSSSNLLSSRSHGRPGQLICPLAGWHRDSGNLDQNEVSNAGQKMHISEEMIGKLCEVEIMLAQGARRHLIENFFCKLKESKRISICACKTDQSFEAMIYVAAAVVNSR